MKHLFIPYELAVIAKEKGFNEPCLKAYSKKYQSDKNCVLDNDICIHNWNEYSGQTYSAPLYQQIVDWFREKHKIFIEVKLSAEHYSEREKYYEAFNKVIESAFYLI